MGTMFGSYLICEIALAEHRLLVQAVNKRRQR
jgi:hypothetical protein